jgi:hypothetical protein
MRFDQPEPFDGCTEPALPMLDVEVVMEVVLAPQGA